MIMKINTFRRFLLDCEDLGSGKPFVSFLSFVSFNNGFDQLREDIYNVP